jgi:RNA polymerase primary sigma factor
MATKQSGKEEKTKRGRGEGDTVLASYLEDISDSTPLSAREEGVLAARIRAGDESARNELVEANLRFAVSVAKEYQNRGMSLVELISSGNVGLITAAERFDESKGYKFISYAVWWIRQAILQALMEQSTVRIPVNRLDMLAKISRTYEKLQRDGAAPSVEKVADSLGFAPEKVEQSLVDNQPVRSLDAPFEDGDERCMLDYLSDEKQLSPEDEVLKFTLKEDINNVLGGLSSREAEVLRLYYGLKNEPSLTLDQIGIRFRLTRERVRQIKEIALNKLRHPRFHAQLRAYADV